MKVMTILIIFALILCVTEAGSQTNLEELKSWFPFSPQYKTAASLLGMADWLDAPAGKHGFLQIKNEKLLFEDGTLTKLWGTNICSRLPYVDAATADSFVNFTSQYGINAIRFHKFTRAAYRGDVSTELDSTKFRRFDYFQAKLREKGIYYGWSHIYGHRVLPGDSSRLLAYSEIKNLSYPWAHLNGSTSSLVNFAPDLQELSIELTVNMLNHVNPYTDLRYAEDPALAFIEFQNEDNIFWSAITKSLEQAPTYRALLCKQFSEWLQNKYGSQAELEKAWGADNITAGESLDNLNIFPDPNHGLFSWEYETSLREKRPMAQHILDKMRFLYETQLTFYRKFEKAIRDTGYRGVLVGSCWQAGSGPAHFYNVHTDYLVGMIDRHNYFGGGAGGHSLAEGEVHNHAMIAQPGSGLLSTGTQQIVDRPFSFSEWMSLVPNEWTAEAAPLIAIYGMGLQGWDASFSFATDIPRFSRFLESERHGVYNATSPLHMGLYPALARLVYRGDVAESPVLATKKVHLPSLTDGTLGFTERVKQGYDIKEFSGTIPPETIAIGRFPVQFAETFQETIIPDLDLYWDKERKIISSATNELTWMYGDKKYVTVNTTASKCIIGFSGGENIKLGDWQIKCENRFVVFLMTDLAREGDLQTADQILITAVARGRNTGMVYEYTDDQTLLTAKGTHPLLLEPVKASITAMTPAPFDVYVLDHDGVKTNQSVPVQNGVFVIEGEKYKTIYYLVDRKN
ncbi:hypothetical protein EH223_19465 [candidate division KSB1 bacterium]|nr:beta-galactosidase [candidate division KSB1 bacterium]RQW00125.1 MAG: hypothetical protein EH223_19465 [candidate division KSB1 bacterium]